MLSISTASHSEGLKKLKEGFAGVKWGTPISEVKGLSKLYQNKDVSYYANPDMGFKINETLLLQAIYGFYSGRFFAVYINIDTTEVFSKISDYMKSQYGSPDMTMKKDQTVYRWKQNGIKIKLKRTPEFTRMKLAFYYTPLSNKLNESQQEKNFDKSIQFLPLKKGKKFEAIPLLVF
jgi:hypothetical protein